MKLNLKEEPPLVEGQVKRVKKFAFIPTVVDNGDLLIWLEPYFENYIVKRKLKARPTAVGMYGIWLAHTHEWVNEWESIGKHSA